MIANPAYADGRPCSVGSSPMISSSSETLSPSVALITRNTIVIVTTVHAATETKPVSWSPKSLNPPP